MTNLNSRAATRAALLLSGMMIAVPLQAQTSGNSSADARQPAALEDIVVTAQKREQNLQVVPIAVTALSATTLQAVRFANVTDLNAVSPGLSVRTNAGGAKIPTFSMRGVFGSTTYASESGIALYVDGVYINGSAGASFDLADIERIEVLRGPQGTLFGRNAIGGAVNLITREPSGQFGGRQEFSYGNYDQFRSKTRIDTPTFGPFSASVTYLHNERRGDIRNLGAGTVWDYSNSTDGTGKRISPKYLGDQDVNAVSGAVKLDPGAGIKAIYRFDYSLNHYTPDGVGTTYLPSFVQPLYNFQPNPSILTPIGTKRPDAVNNAFTTNGRLRTITHSLTASADVTDQISVKNILAFRNISVDSSYQLDGQGGLIDINPTSPTLGSPFAILTNATASHQKTFSDELQLNIKTDWFTLTAGLLHFHSFTVEGPHPGLNNTTIFSAIPNFVLPSVNAQPSRVRVNSDAVYVQSEFHLTDKLDLTGGVRLTKDRKLGLDNSPLPAGAPAAIDYRKSTPSYMVGLNYQPVQDIFTYVKYSTAYISGGTLAAVNFVPTTAKSWEAGIKSDLLDRRLRLNLAVYTVKYNNVQLLTSPLNPGCIDPVTGIPGSLTASQCIVNGGDDRTRGFELEATFVPVRGLTLSGSLAYTHTKYTRVNPFALSPEGKYRPVYDPKLTSNLSAQYTGEEIFAGAHITARVDALYTSRQFGVANSSDFITNFLLIPSSWIVNGRLGLAGFHLGRSEVEIAGWVKNATNDRSLLYTADLTLAGSGTFQRARTFGLDVNFNF